MRHAAASTGHRIEAVAHARHTPTAVDTAAFWVVVGAVFAGGILRAVMANGDLWLDEVWSLTLVRPLSSAIAVFYGVSHDNNHFLNSLWLFWLGSDRQPWAYRAPAVLLGTASIGLAAWIVWPRSRIGAAIAALLVALGLPFVVYGSEARGYAGLLAATLVALAAFDRAGRAPDRRLASWLLGGAVGVGTLFHFTMLGELAILGFTALIIAAAEKSLSRAIDDVLVLFRPALVALLPAMVAVVAGIVHQGGFALGNSAPPTIAAFIRGYGDLLGLEFGVPRFVPPLACLLAGGVLALFGISASGLPFDRRALLLGSAIVLPGGMLLVRCPNLEMARYYLVPGIMLLVVAAESLGALWQRGGTLRLVAIALTGAIILGQGMADRSTLAVGRGHYGEALAMMAGLDGRVRFATDDGFWVGDVARRAAAAKGFVVDPTAMADFCTRVPDWFVAVPESGDDASPATLSVGPVACRHRFLRSRSFGTNPLSGMRWNIYRRLE